MVIQEIYDDSKEEDIDLEFTSSQQTHFCFIAQCIYFRLTALKKGGKARILN